MKRKAPSEKPYDPVLDPAWAKTVDSWQWHSRGNDQAIKGGECPHCGHPMTVRDEVVIEVFQMQVDALGAQRPRKMAYCNCLVQHPNPPDPDGKNQGCGRRGLIVRPG